METKGGGEIKDVLHEPGTGMKLYLLASCFKLENNLKYTQVHTHAHRMESPVAMIHLVHPEIPHMKSYADATAMSAFPTLDQTETMLYPVSQVKSNSTPLTI